MAAIASEVILDVTPNPTDLNLLNVRARFTVRFSDFDIRSALEYQECVQVFGVDLVAGEDNVNDLLTNIGFAIIKAPAGGGSTLSRDLLVPVARATLDEDRPPVPNPDELQVKVTLTPLLPTETTRNSAVKLINL